MAKNKIPTKPAADFLDKIGREELAERLGVTMAALRVAPRQGRGRLPASWFDECESLAIAAGEECDRNLFSFKSKQGAGA